MATDVTCLQCGRPFDLSLVENRFAGVCPACLVDFAAGGGGTDASPEPAFQPPLTIGAAFHGLEIAELLGAGGMGVVYKARQPGLDRFVALKILSPKLSGDPEFVSRFNREAKAMAALSHSGIVQVFDFGQEAGLCFLVMEFVDGVSLRHVMKGGRLAPEQALKVVPKICEALEYAHSKGVIHRDIKPENILLDRDGRVKIADFGLARVLARDGPGRLTLSHVVMGTPGYMAPEQYQSMQVDHRADIFSLGAVFYEMLTGQLPVGRFEPPSKKVRVDVRLDDVVLKALESEPDRRYQRASEFKTGVETVSVVAAPRPAAGASKDAKVPDAIWASMCCMAVSYLVLFQDLRKGNFSSTVLLFQLAALVAAVIGLIQLHQHPAKYQGRPYALAVIFFLLPPFGIIAGFVAMHVLSKFDAAASPAPPPPRPQAPPPPPLPAGPAPGRARKTPEAAWISLILIGGSYAIAFATLNSIAKAHAGPWGGINPSNSIALFLLFQVSGLVTAIVALNLIRRDPARHGGRGYAVAALFLLIPPVGIVAGAVALLVMGRRERTPLPAAGPRVSWLALAALLSSMAGLVLLAAAVYFYTLK